MVANVNSSRVLLFPIDSSIHCERAFQWYADNMKRPNDVIKFISIIEPVYTTSTIGVPMEAPLLPDMAKILEESIANGKMLCRLYMQRAKTEKVNSQAVLHLDSKPGAALVKCITEHKADVVVMGNRGVGAIRRTFLGSISDYVLHHAHVPIVIVPPPAH